MNGTVYFPQIGIKLFISKIGVGLIITFILFISMEIGNFNKLKNRRVSLFFHFFVLSLAVVIDLPHSYAALRLPDELIKYAVSRIFPLVVFYTCYFWLVPGYLAKRKFLTFLLFLVVLINMVTFVGYVIMQLLHFTFGGDKKFHLFYHIAMHLSGSTAMLVAAVFGTVFRIVTGWYDEMQKKSALEEEKLRAELMLLKAQVNPHFLFNTLNNIDSLIRSNPTKASEALIKLSALLRYVIYDAVKELVPLRLELEYIEAYIDLQRLRYSENNLISMEIAGSPDTKMVAPVLFLPFIENAFKHTDAEGIAKGLTVHFQINEDSVDFSCTNVVSARKKNTSGGFGLDNVKKRLDMQYAGHYVLQSFPLDDKYTIRLKLELI
jgi:two-component system, LytTR family, sensor kinase